MFQAFDFMKNHASHDPSLEGGVLIKTKVHTFGPVQHPENDVQTIAARGRALARFGQVWEWCSTIWAEKAYPFKVQDEWTENYLERTGVSRVLRGGSWNYYPQLTRCACRPGLLPGGDGQAA